MPYIKKELRTRYDEVLKKLPELSSKGDLEYCVYKLMLHYMKDRENRYSNLHDTVYAVMHCADEFRRRFLDKREDVAIQENGDICINKTD